MSYAQQLFIDVCSVCVCLCAGSRIKDFFDWITSPRDGLLEKCKEKLFIGFRFTNNKLFTSHRGCEVKKLPYYVHKPLCVYERAIKNVWLGYNKIHLAYWNHLILFLIFFCSRNLSVSNIFPNIDKFITKC